MTTRQTGQNAENFAAQQVKKQGSKIIQRNYHSPYGEIDIVCLDKQTLVFIEVRYRKSTSYGNATETVSIKKQQKIIKTAYCFLNEFNQYKNFEVRFDVIGIEGERFENVRWLQAAFTS